MNAAEVVTVQHLVKRYGNLLVHSDALFPLGVAHWYAQGISQAKCSLYRQHKKITGIFSGGDDNDT